MSDEAHELRRPQPADDVMASRLRRRVARAVGTLAPELQLRVVVACMFARRAAAEAGPDHEAEP